MGDALMDGKSRVVLHGHLKDVLVELIGDDIEQYLDGRRKSAGQMPGDVIVNYVASTFVLVLNWWVDNDSSLSPNEVNDLFRALVLPTLIYNAKQR